MRTYPSFALLAAALLACGFQGPACAAPAPAKAAAPHALKVVAGDVIVQHDPGGAWHPIKILQIDTLPDRSLVAHCIIYNDARTQPDAASVSALSVRSAHSPIMAASFATGWERVGNKAPTKAELAGFIEFLKFTDFPRYLKLTGEDPERIAKDANVHYQHAIELTDKGDRNGALAEYSKAIEIFPLFNEAIDNRGFLLMDMGRYQDALADFQDSLTVDPDGDQALLAEGECLLKLGKTAEAEKIFQSGAKRFPKQRAAFEKSMEQARAARKPGAS